MIPHIDPEVLLYATGDVPIGETPEGFAHEASHTFTIEDEQKRDTLGGTKEMRAKEDKKNENSSKRPKGSLLPDEVAE